MKRRGQKMAHMIKVYQAYSPKIKSAGMLEMHKVIEYLNLVSGQSVEPKAYKFLRQLLI
jgi:hypothetical protein